MALVEPVQVDLFESGREGYHTYRIPALLVTVKGTVLAFCEARKHSRRDDGDIDLVLRRSFDGGRTWEAMRLVWDEGENTVGNPCPVFDEDEGRVWLPFCVNNDRVFVMESRDEGASWSAPVEITREVKLPSWRWYATGPTHGIQLRSGRLLVPCDHSEPGLAGYEQHSHVFYSDDRGGTWRLGGSLGEKLDECVAVEAVDGSVYLNMRSYRGLGRRAYAWSRDGGGSWSEAEHDAGLVEPVCQASLVRFTDGKGGRSRVLFSNPASIRRERMTVRVSYDECRSWPVSRLLYAGPSGYSDLAVTPDKAICCLYERGVDHPYERVTFTRFTLGWLTEGRDHCTDG